MTKKKKSLLIVLSVIIVICAAFIPKVCHNHGNNVNTSNSETVTVPEKYNEYYERNHDFVGNHSNSLEIQSYYKNGCQQFLLTTVFLFLS